MEPGEIKQKNIEILEAQKVILENRHALQMNNINEQLERLKNE